MQIETKIRQRHRAVFADDLGLDADEIGGIDGIEHFGRTVAAICRNRRATSGSSSTRSIGLAADPATERIRSPRPPA